VGDITGIAWTTSTFNPWIGCTKVGPGCDHCYAEAWDQRFDGGAHWGPGAPRRRTNVQNWNKPRRWQRLRREALDRGEDPPPHRVFCASLADVFDNEVPAEWRADLWRLIAECPDLEWQLVTKRVGNVAKMAPVTGLPSNVIVIATIVNQEEADRDLDKLDRLKFDGIASKVGVSYEPALGPVDWNDWLYAEGDEEHGTIRHRLDWIIVGGESAQGGAKARLFRTGWAKSTIDQCRAAGVAVFVKQLGAYAFDDETGFPFKGQDAAGADPAEWPEDLRVREFPRMGSGR
jgi:protein gp37